jgi:hypothetical protein
MRNTRCEHIWSASPPDSGLKSDIASCPLSAIRQGCPCRFRANKRPEQKYVANYYEGLAINVS